MSRRLKVVLASRIFEPETGAAAYRLAALVRALEHDGHEVTVLTTRTPSGAPSTPRVRRWPVVRDRSGAVRGYLPYASFDVPLFFRILFGPRADVCVVEPPPTTGVAARLACALRRRPYVYFSADVTTVAARGIGVNRFALRLIAVLERAALRGATRVLAVSSAVRDEVIALGARPEHVIDVGSGIDTGAFTDGEAAPSSSPYFVYGGTMSEIQGASVFVDAFALLAAERPDVRLLMFGDGVEKPDLMRRAEAGGHGRIEFRGSVPATELAPWLRGATAALASVRPHSGYDFAYATKALVGLACGVPVVYAGAGPLAPLIAANDLGWSVEWEPAAVAAALRTALGTASSGADRARRRAFVVETYSLDAVGARAARVVAAAADGLTASAE
ncbi:MAG: glycosyltransferase [Schumannella sp.]|nr:glycosyltransferase [Schumannella sp.]